MDSGLYKRRKITIRLGLVLMIAVIVSNFFLFPRQYSYPSSITEYSSHDKNERRYYLRQQLEQSKTYDQMRLRISSSQYISQEKMYDRADPQKQRSYQEDLSRKRGEKILESKEITSARSPGDDFGISKFPNKSGRLKAKGLSDWMKNNAVMHEDE